MANDRRKYTNKRDQKRRGRGYSDQKRSNDRVDSTNLVGKENDASWYSKYPQLVTDAARVSFFNALGNTVDLTDVAPLNGISQNFPSKLTLPGIMALDYVPTVGYSAEFSSQINIAARNLYTFIRCQNSGSRNYDSSDMMMYIMAMDSAYSYYAWLLRVYGSASLYSPVNKYFPRALVETYGVDFEDLQSNLANFREYINMFGKKLGSLAIPAETPYSKRHQWMNLNVFYDAATSKGQLYLFNPIGFYQFSETGSTHGTSLDFRLLRSGSAARMTVQEMESFGDSLIASLIASEDAYIMSGDILKAFGTAGVFKVPMISEGFTIVPQYSQEVLTQFQNATIVPNVAYESLRVEQDPNGEFAIVCKPYCTQSAGVNDDGRKVLNPYHEYLLKKKIISLPYDNPTPDQLMIASRLATSADVHVLVGMPTDEGAAPYEIFLTGCGTEIVTNLRFLTGPDSESHFQIHNITPDNSEDTDERFVSTYASSCTSAITSFDYHPCVFVPIAVGTYHANGLPKVIAGAGTICGSLEMARIFTIQNYAALGAYELKNMHEVALLSELTWDKAAQATS